MLYNKLFLDKSMVIKTAVSEDMHLLYVFFSVLGPERST